MSALSKLAALKAAASAKIPPPNSSASTSDEKTIESSSNSIVPVVSNSSGTLSQGSGSVVGTHNSTITEVAIVSTPVAVTAFELSGEVSFETLQFLTKLSELEGMLLSAHPSMPSLLREIHSTLTKDPELVTALSEDQIGVIVNGLKIQTKTELAGTALKAPKGKKLSLNADMF